MPSQPILTTSLRAAESLSISIRTLANLTAAGELPCVRIGRAVRYDVADLRAFIEARKTAGGGA
ncbi:MAG: helix-turn-helix domain-containing protein [Phycisphaerales bacterium]|nr:helix-turn-helix domain-containing protein [Phycisphaerales bacterium]